MIMLVEQLADNRHEVTIQYKRSATFVGNPRAQQAIADVFVPADSAWRGLGTIPMSGYDLAPAYARFDVRKRFDLPAFPSAHTPGCRCGDMLRGICVPTDCALFGKACTPDTPVGPCMVSNEGSCAAYYKYL